MAGRPPRGGVRDVDAEAIDRLAKPLRRVRDYCRVTVEGIEKLPEGPAILVANHTGWTGLDYVNLFLSIYDGTGRAPRVAVHPSYFRIEAFRRQASRLGCFEVSVATATKVLDEGALVTFFPEGEHGNFKPFWKRYELQRFKPGFARVALATMVPIVPVVIIGGEDANPAFGHIRVMPESLDLPVPLPVTLLPLPAKWRVAFMDPIDPSTYLQEDGPDMDVPEAMAADIQRRMQDEIARQIELRGHAFL